MPENRNERLARDFRDMLTIQDRPYLSWIATKGDLPYAEEYLITVRLRSYALTLIDGKYTVSTIDSCTVKVTLWDSYPLIAPNIRMLSIPPVFHPCWYSKGTYCPSELWRPEMSLKDYIMRMVRTIAYDPALSDVPSPANFKALSWYKKHRDDEKLFPSDHTELTENTQEEVSALEKAAFNVGEIIDSWEVGGRD